MIHGSFLSVAATLTILAAVVVLAGLSSLVLGMDGIPERRAVALFWGCLALTWVVAVLVAAALRLGGPW
jgi:hypothetical protein